MSIQSEINRILAKRDLSLDAVSAKGVTVPANSTIDDLPRLIAQIVGDGNGEWIITGLSYEVDENGDYIIVL